jgi:hypothetical protein
MAMAFKQVTQEEVKNTLGPSCPDTVLNYIIKNIPQEKWMETASKIKNALGEIEKAQGVSFKSAELAYDNAYMYGERAQVPVSRTLNSDKIAELFVKYPDKFVEIAKATGGKVGTAFELFKIEDIARPFKERSDSITRAIVEIAKSAGKDPQDVENALSYLSSRRVYQLFVKYPDKFVEIANDAGRHTGRTLFLLTFSSEFGKKEFSSVFFNYCEGRINLNKLMLYVYSSNPLAIEMGRPLDDLHDKPIEREKYLSGLSTIQVLGLLLGNPEYFYTSSNNMLFDRLKRDLKGRTISDIFNEYRLFGTEECRNFLFRAINYGRFYGAENSLLVKEELNDALDTLIGPITADNFDNKYYFILANGLDSVRGIELVRTSLSTKLNERLKELQETKEMNQDEKKILSAMEFLVFKSDPSTKLVSEDKKNRIRGLEDRAIFNPNYYMKEGKLVIVQVFDKEDTEKTSWLLTQQWFNKGEKLREGPGKIVIENKDAKMILFMGKDEGENKEFIKKQLDETPNLIITFRGHSYSLKDNFPPDIFADKTSHVLFIPGSCGSSGSIPEYMAANPNTDITFFSNTSTGIGQVTNAIVTMLMDTKETEKFNLLLDRSSKSIADQGGDSKTIRAFGDGEMLLLYSSLATK